MQNNKNNLVKIILESDLSANDLLSYFEIIKKLIKKYGQILYTIKIQDTIKNTDHNIYFLLQILLKCKKNNISDINNLINEIKISPDYKPSFEINIIQTSTKYNIEEKIHDKFPQSQTKVNKNIDLGIFIHGEGRYYKRNIDQDLEKILG